MKRRWTEAEDELLRMYAERGPAWDGWQRLLPDRTYTAIMSRRQALGIQFKRNTGEPKQPIEQWTDEQRLELVRLAKSMVDKCGHPIGECARELGAVIRTWRRQQTAS